MASGSRKTPPKPVETSAPPASSAGASSFRQEIDKSRAMFEDADQAPAPAIGKNKGGRPSREEVKAREDALKAARVDDLNRLLPPDSLKVQIAFPFELAALGTGFPGWRLSDEEADAIAPSLHEVLKVYAPQINTEQLALVTLAGALFSIGIGKYFAFLQFRATDGASQTAEAGAGSPPASASAPSPVDGLMLPAGVHIT